MAMTNNGTAVPTSVAVNGANIRMTPNELRLLKQATGRNLSDLFADEADAMQAMVWLRLRRDGFDVSWERAGEVEAELTTTAAPALDPTNSGT